MATALDRYRAKRDFTKTREPAGDEPAARGGSGKTGRLRYVIQKHWATRLHYDLRLEWQGTMKSWAVPKGPSLDPAVKRMAVPVEDHPIDYNRFEGRIPAGQYGAGQVIVWDKGWWEPDGDAGRALRDGKLKFTLHGHKLEGEWVLVRAGPGSARAGLRKSAREPGWLLMKLHDAHACVPDDPPVVDRFPDSVSALGDPGADANADADPARRSRSRSRRTPASAAGMTTRSSGSRRAALPATLAPQLATLVDRPPADAQHWIWEMKFDGYRILARVARGKVRLMTRNGLDWTARMPAIAAAVARLPLRSGWLDGEIVMPGDDDVPDFQALQNAFDGGRTERLRYLLFDLLFADGQDLRGLPVVERRERLARLFGVADGPDGEQDADAGPDDRLRLSEAFDAPPADLVASACRLGMEGIIGKRRDATYESRRNTDWIKLKCGLRQEFVIVGHTDIAGQRKGVGALLLAVHDDKGRLRHAGRVGSGFDDRTRRDLAKTLAALATPDPPLPTARGESTGVHWVRPEQVAEVAFAGWTRNRRIRQGVFRGLRADKPAAAIRRDDPVSLAAESRERRAPAGMPRVTHPDRVIDAASGTTKIDLVRYAMRVAALAMPHLADRPVSLVRAPDGVAGQTFFQRHQERGAIDGMQLLDPSLDPGHAPLMVVAKPAALAAAAQLNVIEWHTWNARRDRIERPDRMTFDLDPGDGVDWARVQEGAELLRVLLDELGLPAFLKTSGGKGLHVVVPVRRVHDWDAVKAVSESIVRHLARMLPDRFVAKSGPRNRVGRIYVDFLRNHRGATTVAAWSVRARPGLGISVPVRWRELDLLRAGAHWTIANIGERLRIGNAPWSGYAKAAVSLAAVRAALG